MTKQEVHDCVFLRLKLVDHQQWWSINFVLVPLPKEEMSVAEQHFPHDWSTPSCDKQSCQVF